MAILVDDVCQCRCWSDPGSTVLVWCRHQARPGAAIRSDGEWTEHGQAVVFLPVPDERLALEADPRFWVPAYLGPAGWLGLDLDERTDFGEVAELLQDSFRLTAPARLVAALECRAM